MRLDERIHRGPVDGFSGSGEVHIADEGGVTEGYVGITSGVEVAVNRHTVTTPGVQGKVGGKLRVRNVEMDFTLTEGQPLFLTGSGVTILHRLP